jgi:hypothetical protein
MPIALAVCAKSGAQLGAIYESKLSDPGRSEKIFDEVSCLISQGKVDELSQPRFVPTQSQ